MGNANTHNSFICNINKLAERLDEIVHVNQVFDAPVVMEVIKELEGLDLDVLVNDLRKGSYNGLRKLDIDFYKNINEQTTANSKNKPEYGVIEITTTNGVYSKGFSNTITSHVELAQELQEMFTGIVYNTIISLDSIDNDYSMDLVRLIDEDVPENKLSNIQKITFVVTADTVLYAKNYKFECSWVDSTSALDVFAYNSSGILNIIESLNTIAHISDNLEVINAVNNMSAELTRIYENMALFIELESNIDYLQAVPHNINTMKDIEINVQNSSTECKSIEQSLRYLLNTQTSSKAFSYLQEANGLVYRINNPAGFEFNNHTEIYGNLTYNGTPISIKLKGQIKDDNTVFMMSDKSDVSFNIVYDTIEISKISNEKFYVNIKVITDNGDSAPSKPDINDFTFNITGKTVIIA